MPLVRTDLSNKWVKQKNDAMGNSCAELDNGVCVGERLRGDGECCKFLFCFADYFFFFFVVVFFSSSLLYVYT